MASQGRGSAGRRLQGSALLGSLGASLLQKEWADSLALFRAARNGHAATVQALVRKLT
jgi:hypothetical protein